MAVEIHLLLVKEKSEPYELRSRGTPGEHGPSKRPQIWGIYAKTLHHKNPANGRFSTRIGFHGKEGVVGSSPTEGSLGSAGEVLGVGVAEVSFGATGAQLTCARGDLSPCWAPDTAGGDCSIDPIPEAAAQTYRAT